MRKAARALVVLTLWCASSSGPAAAPADPPMIPHGALGVYARGPSRMVAGTPAALRLYTHWATSETESGPWPGVEIEVALSGGGHHQMVHRGKTDRGGLADARFTVPSWPDGSYTLTVDARAGRKHDAHSEQIQLVPGGKILLSSDKPLYQPGQTIHLRAMAQRPQDGRPVAAHDVVFTISDPRGNQIFRQSQRSSEFGIASLDVPLADELLLGGYHARAELDGDEATAVELALPVERYALPKFKVTLGTDRAFYAPGDRVKLTLEGRYFFGKPAAGAKVSLATSLSGGGVRLGLSAMVATLDSAGKAALEVTVPELAGSDESTLRLTADVEDAAQHRESATRELLVARDPVRVEITTEAQRLVRGVDNRVWVTAARPDGQPIDRAEVELTADDQHAQTATADRIGVAELTLRPGAEPLRGPCGRGRVQLSARVRAGGAVASVKRCVAVAPAGSLMLRTDRAIYPFGAQLTFDVLGLGADGPAFIDVIKDAQTVSTVALKIKEGRGQVTLPPDAARFGTLGIVAYRIAADGTQVRDERLIYVERPSALKVELHPEGDLRPGEHGRIRVKVVDRQSGQGTRAQVGLVMVDQALLALREIKPGAAAIYFNLAREATRPSLAMKAKPGGYTVERLIADGDLDALEQEAARVLLAGASAPWTGWEHDPWQKRKEARDAQVQRLGGALPKWAARHVAGERVRGSHFRWRRDLVSRMVEDGALKAGDNFDPWGRRIEAQAVVDASGLGSFDDWAREQVNERLNAVYLALAREGLDQSLPIDASVKGKARVLTLADLEKLAVAGKLDRAMLTDPWGQPLRIVERPKAVTIARLRSRFVLASAGADGVPGSKDDLFAMDMSYGIKLSEIQVRGGLIGEAFGRGGLGLRGYGMGGGGSGYGSGIGLGRMGTIGHGAGAGSSEPRVRQNFPETMLWRPDVLTDERGEAVVDMELADSITTWQLNADAVAADGRLGSASAEVRVFQDFFVDLDLPPAITQHDELSVPVAVYNYLPTAQRITLELDDAPWFARKGEATQSIDLAPSQVGVRYFRIRAESVGARKLRVRAHGTSAADAIEKTVQVEPDGVERALGFQDRLEPGTLRHTLAIPKDAIADASMAQLKIYPSMATHAIEGLDSMLRMPSGCFEQTSSTTYPKALILEYLKKSGKLTPAVEKKALGYLGTGYQKLLSFEVPGGGFSWFGSAPANKILTAYGIQEFFDMARVFPVDKKVIARTQEWLVKQQRPDGSFAPDSSFINEGATNRFNSDVTRITAYIAAALAHTGYHGPALDKARSYVERALPQEKDPYTLSLAAELLAGESHALLDTVLDRLWQGRTDEAGGKTSSFNSKEKTPTYGDGKSGKVETTARAAYAMLMAPGGQGGRIDRAIGFLLSAKDTFGNWYSTQATILSLKALLAYGGQKEKRGRGHIGVFVDGSEVAGLEVRPGDELMHDIALPQVAQPGTHAIELRYQGSGPLAYQLVGRYYAPRTTAPVSPETITVSAHLDRAEVKAGQRVVEEVQVESPDALDMPIVTAGLPPGFDVDGEALDALVKSKRVAKTERRPRELVLYLVRLEPHQPFTVKVPLTARFPLRVQVPAPTAYEYYKPERRALGRPLEVIVGG